MSRPPSTLDDLRKLSGTELIAGAAAYIKNGESKISEARRLRDVAVAELARELGPAETARRVGLSISSVKTIRRVGSHE